MIKKINILILGFILSISSLYGEGGSNYSAFGIGDIETVQGAAYWGSGGTSIAVPSPYHINMVNPAMWSTSHLTRMQLGYRFQQNLVSSSNNEIYQNFGSIDGLNALFVVDTAKGFSFGFGVNAFSNVDYSISSAFSREIDGLPVSGKLETAGSGGIKKIYIGASYKPLPFLAIGFNQNGYIGNIQRDAVTLTNQSYAHDSFTGRKFSFSGNNQRIGLNLEYSNFMLGMFYETAAKIETNSDLIYISYYDLISSRTTIVDTSFSSNSEFEIPASFGVGLSYLTGKFRLAADYTSQDFSGFNFNQGDNGSFQATNAFSFGLERLGNTSAGAKRFDKWTYRFGLGYKDLYLAVADKSVNETYLSFGFSAPFGKSSMFDYAMVFGTRGEISDPLVQEYFARFYFNVSIGEQWFVPFKREFED